MCRRNICGCTVLPLSFSLTEKQLYCLKCTSEMPCGRDVAEQFQESQRRCQPASVNAI